MAFRNKKAFLTGLIKTKCSIKYYVLLQTDIVINGRLPQAAKKKKKI